MSDASQSRVGAKARTALAFVFGPHLRSPAAMEGSAASGEILGEIAQLSPDEALKRLGSSLAGLTPSEVEERRHLVGPNQVARRERQTILGELAGRSLNPLNMLLLALATTSYFIGDQKAAIVIAVMVLLSVSLGFFQEHRSNRAADALRRMVQTNATVRRRDSGTAQGHHDVPVEQVTPGDIVLLSAGDMIPADMRLISSKDLFVTQSTLTGEAMPLEKFAHAHTGSAETPFDLPNICFMGSAVVSGVGCGVVALTGARTAFGQVAGAIAEQRVLTSFDKGITRVTWMMLVLISIMVPLVFLINGLSKGNWFEALLFAVAVAVGLTPEMLPMIVTVNLAKGAMAMAKKKVIVKRLNAIQNFGAMDVLCTDKTGTLTQDRIILKRHLDLRGEDSERVLEYAYLNSFHQSGLKNLLDVAVLNHVELREKLKAEERYRKLDEVPFDFERRRMSVVLERGDAHILICKGAVEEVLAVCTRYAVNGETGALDENHFAQAKATTAELNADGFRIIAVAFKEMPPEQAAYSVADEADLTLLGYIAFLDPPKETAAPAIATLNARGVRVKILTGDNDIVARKVCRDVGLPVDRIVLGHEIEALPSDELANLAETAVVFAKVSPSQKAAIIDALHRKGHVVGFLGDGINDGPALKAADVGISVDSAVDIAKETADIILLEKSLTVLGDGVIEGRKVFGNITKYIKMGASSGFGNMFSVIGASVILPFLPMAPIQVLTNNLLYDVSQTAIPTDNVDAEYLAAPRRWDIGNISKFVLMIGPISSIFDYVTYFMMLDVFDAWDKPALFQTGWFVESLLTQTLIIHIIRTAKIPFVESLASAPLIATSIVIAAIGVALPFSGLGSTLGFVPLPGAYWIPLFFILLSYATLTHLMKTWFSRRFGLD